MKAIKVTKKIESETLIIPELKNFIGKKIEITMLEIPLEQRACVNKNEKMGNFFKAAGKIDLAESSIAELREKSFL